MPVPYIKSYGDFSKVLRNNKYLVVNFTASWCGPCKAIAPKIDDLYDDPKYKKIQIVRVDIEEVQQAAEQYKVQSIPTFIFFEAENEVKRVTGGDLKAIFDGLDDFASRAKRNGSNNGGGRFYESKSTGIYSVDAIASIPPVTRFFTITSVMIFIVTRQGWVSLAVLRCDLSMFVEKFSVIMHWWSHGTTSQVVWAVLALLGQSYRFFTTFMVPAESTNPLMPIMDIYFFYTFANHLESYQGKFKRNFPDCLWFTLITGTMIVLMTFGFTVFLPHHYPQHHQLMLSCVTYLWSRGSKNSIIRFLGIIPIKSYYLPVFNLFFKLISSPSKSDFLDTLVGIFGGYLYQCIASGTLPIYNLFPSSYSQYRSSAHGNRVGSSQNVMNDPGYLEDSVYDKGYLKAPVWLYKLLNYPLGTTKRTTAFTTNSRVGDSRSKPQAYASGASRSDNSAFRGRGYRLSE